MKSFSGFVNKKIKLICNDFDFFSLPVAYKFRWVIEIFYKNLNEKNHYLLI
jgi:hypothetical protein